MLSNLIDRATRSGGWRHCCGRPPAGNVRPLRARLRSGRVVLLARGFRTHRVSHFCRHGPSSIQLALEAHLCDVAIGHDHQCARGRALMVQASKKKCFERVGVEEVSPAHHHLIADVYRDTVSQRSIVMNSSVSAASSRRCDPAKVDQPSGESRLRVSDQYMPWRMRSALASSHW